MANIVDIVIKGVDKSKKAITAPIKNLKDLKTAAAALGPAFIAAAAIVGTALIGLTARAITVQEETAKMATRLGVTTEELSTLGFAAKISGTNLDTVQKGLRRLSVQVLDAGRGLKEAKDNFADLGIEVRNTDGTLKASDQLFKDVADSISKLPDGLEKSALAQKVFGKSGAELIPLLNEGSAGIEQLQAKARALGIEIDTNTSKEAEELIDNITILTTAFEGAFNTIASELLPGLVALTDEFTGTKDGPIEAASAVDTFVNAVSFLGKVAISVVSALKAVFEGLGTLIAGVAFAIFELLQGNFSAAKDAIAESFGEIADIIDTSAKTINKTWDDSNNKRVESTKKANKAIIGEATKTTAQLKREAEKVAREQDAINQRTASRQQQTAANSLAAVGVLTTKNANAQKAVSIGQATISAFGAINKTLETGGFFALPLAISIGALALANVAKISGIGFQEGGIVPGTSFTGDRILAGLNSQEVVLTAAQTENLAGQLAGGAGDITPVRAIGELDGQVFLDFLIEANQDGRFPITASSLV